MMIRTIKYKNPGTTNPFLVANSDDGNKTALLVFTADRGLCGSFNSGITKKALIYLSKHPDTDVVCVGKKGYDALRKKTDRIIEKYLNFFSSMDFSKSRSVSDLILDLYLNQGYTKVDAIYNEFKSAIQQNVIERQLLPIVPIEDDLISDTDYLYEPNEDALITELGTKFVDVDIWRMMLESSAAEQGARMTAMDNATENAGELIQELSLLHNRARQASITTEIIEIASGAEAINE